MHIRISPKTLTIITTYQCTAACADCCFECTPKITHRLSLEEITQAIDSAISTYSQIEMVVFTGGECFILKDDLFKAIYHCTERNLKTRCVTNAFWAKRPDVAKRYARKLLQAGIFEINISTGLDHQQWVSENSVLNAVEALTSNGIFTLVTVEKDSKQSACLERIQKHNLIQNLMKTPKLFCLQSNAWMTFFNDSERREAIDTEIINKGCDQIYENIVITPKREVSACCGLTLEHIPEMKLGNIDELSCYTSQQVDDFLKLWIKVDGPFSILEKILGKGHPQLKGITHQCEACALLHREEYLRTKLSREYSKFVPSVINKYNLIETKIVQ